MKEYYIICMEERAKEGTLLFWKPESNGYTSNFEKAGLFNKELADEVNNNGRDLALTKKSFEKMKADIYTVVWLSQYDLQVLKEKHLKSNGHK